MATTTLDQTRIQREREVENALASVRMEGLEPSAEAKGIFQRYVEGDLTLSEIQQRCLEQLRVPIGLTALWHRLEYLGLSYKKNDARRRARSA